MKKKKKKPQTPALPADPALEEFCQSVHIEEISFESWEESHSALDLRIPFFCSLQTAALGGDHPVKFSRCIDSLRKPTTHVISFPPGIHDGQEVRVIGLGDEANGKLGDLIVIVRIKG